MYLNVSGQIFLTDRFNNFVPLHVTSHSMFQIRILRIRMVPPNNCIPNRPNRQSQFPGDKGTGAIIIETG